jgi:hypothetical protein
MATNKKIIFRDAAIHISSTADGDLSIAADDEIDITSTLIDINGNVEISGTATTTGVHTFTAVPVFPNNTVESADIQADAITGAKIADNAINSEHYTDGSIDTAHIGDDQITAALMADNSIDSDMYVDGSIDTAHIADSQITIAKMAEGTFVKQQDPTTLPYKDLDSAAHAEVGNFVIDERGRYKISWELRMGWRSQVGYVTTYLGTSSAGGRIGNYSMVIENLGQGASANANQTLTFQKVMDFGTNLSYPYTVYVNCNVSSASSTTLFNQSDVNGYPVVSCLKIADIATATNMVAFGT